MLFPAPSNLFHICIQHLLAALESNENPDQVKLTQDFSTTIQSIINEVSSRFTQFSLLAETSTFILHQGTISMDKLNLEIFEWLNLADMEMILIDFQSSSIWKQKFVHFKNELEIIGKDRLLGVIKKNVEEKLLITWNAIPETFGCLKKLATTILIIVSSTYA